LIVHSGISGNVLIVSTNDNAKSLSHAFLILNHIYCNATSISSAPHLYALVITVFNASLSESEFCNAAGTRFLTALSNVKGTQAIDPSTQELPLFVLAVVLA
jgi:hypothetical protein